MTTTNGATTCYVYSREFRSLLDKIEVSPYMHSKPLSIIAQQAIDVDRNLSLENLYISDTLYCSYCATGFLDKESQRAHYKLDWHQYNLKQALACKKPVTEERFAQLADDDITSISGSESGDDELESADLESSLHEEEVRLKTLIARRSRVLFNNSKGKVISVHRCLLLNKKDEAESDDHLCFLLTSLPLKTQWLILMVGGGHFAAAIFNGPDPVLHKTFHSYTVRAKQGGTQSTKDNKGGHSKSAGASLRRYNEQSFSEHIQDLLKLWGADIVKCDLIFYRALGREKSTCLFAGPNPAFLKVDPRLRTIPFPTRRPTFNEVKRVHSLLSVAFVYDSDEMFKSVFSSTKPVPISEAEEKRVSRKNSDEALGSPKKTHIDRGKERPSPVRELPGIVQRLAALSSSCSDDDMEILMEMQEISLDHLKEFDDSVPEEIKEKIRGLKKHKKKKKEPNPTQSMRDEVEEFWRNIHSNPDLSNLPHLTHILETAQGDERLTSEDMSQVLNQTNIHGETILHNAALQGFPETVTLLMSYGADPGVKDKKSMTPYDHAPDKNTRNAFRRFMGEHPTLYDFSKSHIPSALTDEIAAEIAEKKRAIKKAKRAKDKERKAERETQKKEELEREHFLQLSDKEKTALINCKKALISSGQLDSYAIRCFFCALSMTGKDAFEYSSFKFCSMNCLKSHRQKSSK